MSICVCMHEVKSLSRVQLFATPWTVAYHALPSRGFPGNSTGVGCHFLLQGIFPTQGSNPGLPHCRQTVYRLSHQGRYVCISVCIFVCICLSVHCIHICMCAYLVWRHIRVYLCVCLFVCSICICMYVHLCVSVCVCAHVCAFPDHGMALRGGGHGHSPGKARGGSAAPQRAPYDSRPGPLVP